jgi:mono/diheme cytochrome c family protein
MKLNTKFLVMASFASVLIWACKNNDTPETPSVSGTTFLEPSPQRAGNATAGKAYLEGGSYVSSGIPLDIFKLAYGANSPDDLGRTGDNKGIVFNFSATTASNGVKVVSTNCFNCHAERSPADGALIMGLGNTTADNTQDVAQQFGLIDNVVKARYGANSPEWKAYYPLSRGFTSIAPFIRTETRGPNPADKIFAALSAFRSGKNLTWLDQPQFAIPKGTIPTDVPAWWLMHKKNALYYDGLGRGDFARLSMATALVSMADSAEARKIDNNFPDVMAYISSLRVPQYPNTVDQTLATKGMAIFNITCAKCHGTYGTTPTYPNLLVDLQTIKTDSALATAYYTNPQYHTWYNTSWFNQGANAGQLLPNRGYVAPPLDGIWATAPYLHNGSVPTLDDLLNSAQRPAKWSRTFDNKADFDPVKMGIKYKVETAKADVKTYDTTTYAYGNGGHYFGDKLTADERKAVIEYLKTL